MVERRVPVKLSNATDEANARSGLIDLALVLGTEVLIDQTVQGKLDLLADCAGWRLMPHPDRPN